MIVGKILTDKLQNRIKCLEGKLDFQEYLDYLNIDRRRKWSKTKVRNYEAEINRLKELLYDSCSDCGIRDTGKGVTLDRVKRYINNNDFYFIQLKEGLYSLEVTGLYEKTFSEIVGNLNVGTREIKNDQYYRKVIKKIKLNPDVEYYKMFNRYPIGDNSIIAEAVKELSNYKLLNVSYEEAMRSLGVNLREPKEFIDKFDTKLKYNYMIANAQMYEAGIENVLSIGKRTIVRVKNKDLESEFNLDNIRCKLYR